MDSILLFCQFVMTASKHSKVEQLCVMKVQLHGEIKSRLLAFRDEGNKPRNELHS